MPSAYIRNLTRSLEEAERDSQLGKNTLEERFLDWLNSQPEIGRHRPYAMAELEKALGTQGRYISPILLSLGWERRRKWSSKSQYLRYWVPPEFNQS